MEVFSDFSSKKDDFFRSLCRIEETARPVKLQRIIYGYPVTGNPFQFNLKLTYALSSVVNGLVAEQLGDRQILIFCQSRNDVESSLAQLSKDVQLPISGNRHEALEKVAEK